ncbi:MAG: SBBP repeat-containing protein [Steroidobacteraceae bacterium]
MLLPERRVASFSNYFIGDNPKRWSTHVPNFAAIEYENVYPGIDWVIYGNRRHVLEYDFVVRPHADPARVALAVTGAEHLSLNKEGELLIDVHGRILRQLPPVIYQVSTSGIRGRIKGSYTLTGGRVRVALGPYDHRRTLYIDPALAYSTYLGGTCCDQGRAIAVDAEGDAYVTGQAGSTDFPTVDPYQTNNPGGNAGAAFIAKFDPTGTRLLYSTYLGGSDGATIAGIAVDSAGSIYVAGGTASKDFPVVNAYQSQFKGTGQSSGQGFVTKFSPDGSTLDYSTYLGGSGANNGVSALAIDSAGDAYVAGSTNSTDFPTTAQAIQGSLRGLNNVVVTELNPSGNGLVYSTYLGGSGYDSEDALAIDASGDAYVAGSTNSSDFPLVHPFQSTNYESANGSTNPTAFVAKIAAGGTTLDYSSYLGGSGSFDEALGIAVDSAGNACVTGATESTDFPTVNPYQATNRDAEGLGGTSAFVTKVNSTGTALVYSTYLGGSGGGQGVEGELGFAIAIDAAGDAYITGSTSSTDFPTVNAVQETNDAAAIGSENAFVSELDPTGSKLLFSTYLGGSGSWGPALTHPPIPLGDSASGIAIDGSGGIYVVGTTGSSDFPTLNAFQSTNKTVTQYGADQQAFVAKFGVEESPPGSTTGSGTGGGGGTIGWDVIALLTLALGFRWSTQRRD